MIRTDTHLLVGHIFRQQAVRIVAALTRVFGTGRLDLVEDVLQDALIKALQQWPFKGIPENPVAWITVAARNRAVDLLRRDSLFASKAVELDSVLGSSSSTFAPDKRQIDDQLSLIMMCCHPALATEGQIALTLKLACGFSTTEIARACLTPETTVAQRLVRAKRSIREKKITLDVAMDEDLDARLESTLRVIYLIFNEGYAATTGDDLVRIDLCHEAIRLGVLLTDHERWRRPSVHALVGLMMLQAARLPARTDSYGGLTLLVNQDRTIWDRRLIAGGLRHFGASGEGDVITTYHLQAEIAAITQPPLVTSIQTGRRSPLFMTSFMTSNPHPSLPLIARLLDRDVGDQRQASRR